MLPFPHQRTPTMSVRTSSTRRHCLHLIAALPLAAAVPARAQVHDLADAVNKAGRLRMLSQRLVKAWLALGQGVETERAQRVLDDSLAQFDRQLVELRAFASAPAAQATYRELDNAWGPFKGQLVGRRPELSAAPALLAQDARILALAHQGTQQLEALSDKPTGPLINQAGRQRMLSQRMAKYRLASSSPALAGEAREQIQTARREFVQTLDALDAAPQATRAIRDEVALARGQWVFFDQALTRPQLGAGRESADLFISSENLLLVMDRITGLYARLGA